MPKQPFRRAITSVLLDRDGTVIVDKHYLSDPKQVELLPRAAEGLRQLSHAGMQLFMVTNQSGIGRGYFTETEYRSCSEALEEQLRAQKIPVVETAFCPHAPEDCCDCRKPSLGMWHNLASRYTLEPSRTAMVGDKAEDILFGRAAGVGAAVLVLTGKGVAAASRMQLPLPEPGADFCAVDVADNETFPHAVARDIAGAAAYILSLNV